MSMFMATLVLVAVSAPVPYVAPSFSSASPSLQTKPAAVPDFSGTWTLDPAKSKLGELPFVPMTLKVAHKDPEITTTRISEGVEDTVAFRTDGKQTKAATTCCGELLVSAQWKGSTLVRVLHGENFTQRDTWSLAESGQELSMIRRIESSDGTTVDITLVYRRQKQPSALLTILTT
jgi:hypothetical protein